MPSFNDTTSSEDMAVSQTKNGIGNSEEADEPALVLSKGRSIFSRQARHTVLGQRTAARFSDGTQWERFQKVDRTAGKRGRYGRVNYKSRGYCYEPLSHHILDPAEMPP